MKKLFRVEFLHYASGKDSGKVYANSRYFDSIAGVKRYVWRCKESFNFFGIRFWVREMENTYRCLTCAETKERYGFYV